MVKLRLKRIGRKKVPFYRIVVSDSRTRVSGEYIELLGTYNSLTNEVILKDERACEWIKKGAQPTDTVRDILKTQGVLKKLHEEKMSKNTEKPKKEKSVKKPVKPAVKKTATKTSKPAVKKEQETVKPDSTNVES